MSAIKRTLVVDPDTRESAERWHVDTSALPVEDFPQLQALISGLGLPAQVERARVRLDDIAGLPEHDEAAAELAVAADCCARANGAVSGAVWDEAKLHYERFIALYEHGMRRLAARRSVALKDKLGAGGRQKQLNAADERKGRDLEIVADFDRLSLRHGRAVIAVLANKHRLHRTTIKRILRASGRNP